MKLVIFDLDQTLVDFIHIHNETTRILFKREFGVEAWLTDTDFAGKSLLDNFRELAEIKHIRQADFDEKKGELLGRYETIFEAAVPSDGAKYILPGAKELLSALVQEGHFIVLYTGGSRRIAEKVLEVTGMGRYFALRFYGTEVTARTDMVRMAIERAGEICRRTFHGGDVVIIGDSIRDVDCAKAFQAFSIAVATGYHSRQQLSRRGADVVLKSLRDWREIVRIVGGRSRVPDGA